MNGIIQKKKVSSSGSQGLFFMLECIVVIKSVQEDKGYLKYYIMVRLYLGHIVAKNNYRTSHTFNENQPMHRNRNFLKVKFNENL